MTGRRLLLRNASTAPGRTCDLAIADGVLVEPAELGPAHEVADLGGRPVLPGLVDHHLHLHALAAARASVDLGPAALERAGGLGPALRRARAAQPDGWLRGVGYDITASGPIDRHVLDVTGAGPVRVQDRTGIHWALDSVATAAVLPDDLAHDGVFTRQDHWLGHRVPPPAQPLDLGAVGRELAALGLTAVTDAGADNDASTLARLAAADLPLRVTAMTRAADTQAPPGIGLGPVKVLLDDTRLPALADLAARVADAHAHGRTVAVHCVSVVQTVLALSAGLRHGDRIEHASDVPADVLPLLRETGVTVVVNPGLVRTRGDRHLVETDPADHPALHRLRSFLDAGIPTRAGSDAPYGDPDPWLGIAAAVDRRTQDGQPLNPDEAVGPRRARDIHVDGRTLTPGQPADLVVLDEVWADGWDTIARRPAIALTVLAGRPTHGAVPA